MNLREHEVILHARVQNCTTSALHLQAHDIEHKKSFSYL